MEPRLNTTKEHIHQSNEMYFIQHKINIKKLKQGLVAFYNIRPGNGAGLFSKEKINKKKKKKNVNKQTILYSADINK